MGKRDGSPVWITPAEFQVLAKNHPTQAIKAGHALRKSYIAEIKAMDDPSRAINFRITTGAVDRDHDIINPAGWDFGNYLRCPTVLFAHDYSSLPVAKTINITADSQGLVALAEFAVPMSTPSRTPCSKMNCPVCHSTRSLSYYKADMPQILSACPAQALKRVKVLPLEARLCLDCSLGFNATPLDTRMLKSIYNDYCYISPHRGIGASKYVGMVATITRHLSLTDTILDVGCSDGYLLDRLREYQYIRLMGIEPGPQAIEAQGIGLDVYRRYFHARSFPGKYFDGIILMHVFEHMTDPVGMLKALKAKLTPTGKLIIEVPDFAGYHHQHLFFYTLPSLRKLAEGAGLKTIETFEDEQVLRLVLMAGHEDVMTEWGCELNCETVKNRALSIVQEFQSTVRKLRTLCKTHKKIYWWGAGSSSVFWLNQIGASALKRTDSTVVDGDSAKWGMFIPGVGIKVRPFGILAGDTVDLMIIASEFSNEIKVTMKAHGIHAGRVEVVI